MTTIPTRGVAPAPAPTPLPIRESTPTTRTKRPTPVVPTPTATTTTVTTYECPHCHRSGLTPAHFPRHRNGQRAFQSCRRCEAEATIAYELRENDHGHRFYEGMAITVYGWIADRARGLTREYLEKLRDRGGGGFIQSSADIAERVATYDHAVADLIRLGLVDDANGTLYTTTHHALLNP